MEGRELDHAARVGALRGVPLFRRLSTATIHELARRTGQATVGAGTVLVRQGDPGDHLGIVVAGSAAVTRDGHPIGSLGEGDFFGEMSLIDGEPRSATVTTTSDAVLLRVTADDFEALLKIPHVARALLEGMSARLREVHQSL